MIRSAVLAGLLAAGCEVVDVGICPTPSMQLAVKWLEADGGIAITAGHNPWQWNALKFVRSDGLYLTPTQGEELLDIFHQGEYAKAGWDTIKQVIQTAEATEEHIKVLDKLTQLLLTDTKVTAAGLRKLPLPKCRVEWPGGVIEPLATDRAITACLTIRSASGGIGIDACDVKFTRALWQPA